MAVILAADCLSRAAATANANNLCSTEIMRIKFIWKIVVDVQRWESKSDQLEQ